MDYPSSSASPSPSEYKGMASIQERDWLTCSTSTAATHHIDELQDASAEVEEEDTNTTLANSQSNLAAVIIEREHMFDKVVTPSDVGKLNRLVIPKQHAEKYFPIDSSGSEKAGLLLNFEDSTGKSWRFRYSYWNSSQSYVMTKGWSRFVKEKALSAGDIVSFQRGVGEQAKHRFFIDWRRRPPDQHHLQHHHHHLGTAYSVHRSIPAAAAWTPGFILRSHPHPPHPHPWGSGIGVTPSTAVWDHSSAHLSHMNNVNVNMNASVAPYSHGSSTSLVNQYPAPRGSLVFLRSSFSSSSLPPSLDPQILGVPHHITSSSSSSDNHREGIRDEATIYESVPVAQGQAKSAGKRLRLFGVNMDCPPASNDNQDYIKGEDQTSPKSS